jgi:glycogen debranching enzyme
VLRADGSYPRPPLALVEVQGYAYQALMLMAPLLRRTGQAGRAGALEADAARLRARFLKDFWMEEEGCYCLALEQGGRQVASVTSNAAQVLWTGIATPAHAGRVAERTMRPDGVDRLALHDIQVGGATASLSFERQGDAVSVDILGKADGIRVEVLV